MTKCLSLTFLLGISIALFSAGAQATPTDTPAQFTPFFMHGFSSPTIFYGDSHSGFGSISVSDTNAEMAFNEACDASHVQGAAPDDAQTLTTLRERVFEFLTYEVASRNPSVRPVPITVPTCVRPTSAGPMMSVLLPRHSPTDAEVGATQNPLTIRLMKFRGVWAQTRPSAVIFAVVFDDLLKNREALACTGDPKLESICLDVRYARLRLKGTFAFLFESPNALAAQTSIRDALVRLLGTDVTTQSAAVIADIVASGAVAYSEITSVKDSALFQTSLETAFRHATQLAAPPGLRQALKNLLDVGEALLKKKDATLQAEADGVCNLDLPTIASQYPNVVRQALLDTAAPQAQTIRASLCLKPEFRNQQRPPSCSGVSGGPLPGPVPVIVNRRSSEFPFANLNILTLSQPTSADPVELHVRVHFIFDSEITPDEMSQTLTRWQSAVNAWYTCQTGATGTTTAFDNNFLGGTTIRPVNYTCPAGYNMTSAPPMKFDLQYTADAEPTPADGPQVLVHRCYRMEVKSSDCSVVRDFAVRKCQSRCALSDQTCSQACASKQIGDLQNNRANSGNFILGQQLGTLIHETGHLMGLDDEYLDPELPFAPLGRPHGIMTNDHVPNPRLDITHVHRMLEPLTCR